MPRGDQNSLKEWTLALRSKTNQVYRYSTDSFKGLTIILDYFKYRFPLKTTKLNPFNKWSEVWHLMVIGDHLTKVGFNKIQELAKEVKNNPFNYPDSLSNDGV
jgi:hypothetical protein